MSEYNNLPMYFITRKKKYLSLVQYVLRFRFISSFVNKKTYFYYHTVCKSKLISHLFFSGQPQHKSKIW